MANQDNVSALIQQMELLKETLPCSKCRQNFKKYWSKNPLQEGMDPMTWLYELTKNVRLENGAAKRVPNFTYNQWHRYFQYNQNSIL